MHHAVSTKPGHAAGGTKPGHAAGSTRLSRTVGLLLTAAVLLTGQSIVARTALGAAVPASADIPPAGTDRTSQAVPDDAGVQLGPATKFVREPDGSVRQLR